MFPGRMKQLMIVALDDEPLFHSMVWARRDIILQAFPHLGIGLVHELLKYQDFILEGIGFLNEKNLATNALEHFSQVDTTSLFV
jgi:hypothetical protein